MIGGSENLDRAVFPVVSSGNSEMCLLLRCQRIANRGDGADQFLPAELLAKTAIVRQSEIAQRSAGCEWDNGGHDVSADGPEGDIEDGGQRAAGRRGKGLEHVRAGDRTRGKKRGVSASGVVSATISEDQDGDRD